MATETPPKLATVDCFVCLGTNLTRNYLLKGRKCREEGFLTKLKLVLNHQDTIDALYGDTSSSICRTCYNTVEKTYSFLNCIRDSAARYVLSSTHTRTKRYAPSDGPQATKKTPVRRSPLKAKESIANGNQGHESKREVGPGYAPTGIKSNSSETGVESRHEHGDVDHDNATTNEIESNSSQADCESNREVDHGYAKTVKSDSSVTETVVLKVNARFTDCIDDDESERGRLLQELRRESDTLLSRAPDLASVLYKYRAANQLAENVDGLFNDIVLELANRVPLLLDVMCCVIIPHGKHFTRELIPPLAACYAIMMRQKYNNLSAFHRLVTAIAIKGGLDDKGQTRLNHLGLMLSVERRAKLQDAAAAESRNILIKELTLNPLLKLTAGNLDVHVKTGSLSEAKRNHQLHLFTSSVAFCRVAKPDMNDDAPDIDVEALRSKDVMISDNRQTLLDSYKILLGRVLTALPPFSSFGKFLPKHIPHPHLEKMSKKSVVHNLPIQFRNESKPEDCLAIMDKYEEQLSALYTVAYGDANFLSTVKVTVGGDQRTRVRLQDAKNQRKFISSSPAERFDDLEPIVCEMWHNKQDFLQKCYNQLFKRENTPGTLYFFKKLLHRLNISGKVEGQFQPHHDLLLAVGQGLIVEQMLEFFQMEDTTSEPQHPLLKEVSEKSCEDQQKVFDTVMKCFIEHYQYGTIDRHEAKYKIIGVATNGSLILAPDERSPHDPDELYNYSMNLCHWALHMLELDDTAKEGDTRRLVLNCQYNLPFFYSHSDFSRYLVENIDFILKSTFTLSPLQRTRVLEGAFINVRGGEGNNVESDLVQEHLVGNRKNLIKSLGVNKTELTISRVTGAADSITEICDKFDKAIYVKIRGPRQTKFTSEKDIETIRKELRKLRPFRYTPGRKCNGFSGICPRLLTKERHLAMKQRINQIITKLTSGMSVNVDDEDDQQADETNEDPAKFLPEL